MSNKVLVRDPKAPVKAKGMVHEQIAHTAKALTREHYDQLARNNRFFKKYPDVEDFAFRKWPLYIDMARQMLTAMLGSPKYDTAFKDGIFDALTKDGAINPKKMAEPAKPVITFSDIKRKL